MYFEIHKSTSQTAQPYWWVIKSLGNHATLATSEMYSRKEDCVYAIKLVANNGTGSKYYDKTGE